MYRQILVHKEDQDFQRIVFRRSPNKPIEDFRLKTVTFGVSCAPYLAIRTIHQLAQDGQDEFPLASNILLRETYVDDILLGGHNIQSTTSSLTQVNDALKSAGFPLRKITSNHPKILESVPDSEVLDVDFLQFQDTSSTKMLGIKWNALTDSFSYTYDPVPGANSRTKRQILSAVAKLFDPEGWLTPIMISAKMLLQQLCMEGTDWDEHVKPGAFHKWNTLRENLPAINEIVIPRWVQFSPTHRVQVHGFSDASEKAYCACVYLRVQIDENSFSSHILAAKKQRRIESLHTIESVDILERFSSFARALRVIAFMYRFINAARKQPIPTSLPLTHEEINQAKLRIIGQTPSPYYINEISSLNQGKSIRKKKPSTDSESDGGSSWNYARKWT
ncbi:uncharacterized protein LOC118754070, partial [Rhagoletis pomonella]|uniref:uncharacterized protein LOC118754070 n=1 Tax=Rhagoletis pomonella TaxID=28610 RepID=UPI0017805375